EVGDVEAFITDKEVIQTSQLAGIMTAYLFASKEEAKRAGLNVEGIPIQELMIYLTEKEGAYYAKSIKGRPLLFNGGHTKNFCYILVDIIRAFTRVLFNKCDLFWNNVYHL